MKEIQVSVVIDNLEEWHDYCNKIKEEKGSISAEEASSFNFRYKQIYLPVYSCC